MNIHEFIKLKGSKAAAARELDVPWQTVDRWEKGLSKPSRAMIKVARLKGVELDGGSNG